VALVTALSGTTRPHSGSSAVRSAALKQDVTRLDAIVQLFIAGKHLSHDEGRYTAAVQNRRTVLARLAALRAPSQLQPAATTLRQMTKYSLSYNSLMAQGQRAKAHIPDVNHNALRPRFVHEFNPYAQRFLRRSYTFSQL
jgi:hypothetical protein